MQQGKPQSDAVQVSGPHFRTAALLQYTPPPRAPPRAHVHQVTSARQSMNCATSCSSSKKQARMWHTQDRYLGESREAGLG